MRIGKIQYDGFYIDFIEKVIGYTQGKQEPLTLIPMRCLQYLCEASLDPSAGWISKEKLFDAVWADSKGLLDTGLVKKNIYIIREAIQTTGYSGIPRDKIICSNGKYGYRFTLPDGAEYFSPDGEKIQRPFTDDSGTAAHSNDTVSLAAKEIRLYLASTSGDLEDDRAEFISFIAELNRRYQSRGIFIRLVCREYMSHALPDKDSRQRLRQDIQSCDLAFFLIGRAVSESAAAEFDAAWEGHQAARHPVILIYERRQTGSDGVQAAAFKDHLRTVSGNRSRPIRYEHMDSVKLHVLLELQHDCAFDGSISIEEGHIILSDQRMLSLDNIPLFSKNEPLMQCKAQKEALNQKYRSLTRALLFAADEKERRDIRGHLHDVDEQRDKIAQSIHQMETAILEECDLLSGKRQIGRQSAVNWREHDAWGWTDIGKYDEAIDLLRDKAWDQEIGKYEAVLQSGANEIKEYISGKRLLIQNLKATGINAASALEIRGIYDRIAALAEKWQTELGVLYEYAEFLRMQRDYPESIRIAERLKHHYALSERTADDERADLLNLLAKLYFENRNYPAAETEGQAALSLRRKLAGDGSKAHKVRLAETCMDLARLYWQKNRPDREEPLLLECLNILKSSAGGYSELSPEKLARAYNQIAVLCRRNGRIQEAIAYHLQAKEIRGHLKEENLRKHGLDYSVTCNNLAYLYKEINKFQEAEQLYREALDIRRELAKENPSAYESSVALVCTNLASLLRTVQRNALPDGCEAEQLCKEALEIRSRLADKNPSAYQASLSNTNLEYAILLSAQHKFFESQQYFQKTVEVREQLKESAPDVYTAALGAAYHNYALLLLLLKKYHDAEEYFFRAIKLYREIRRKNHFLHGKYLVLSAVGLAMALRKNRRLQEAEPVYQEALAACPENMDEDPSFLSSAAVLYSKYASFLADTNRWDEAKAMYDQALDVFFPLAQEAPSVYKADVIAVCHELAELVSAHNMKPLRSDAADIVTRYPKPTNYTIAVAYDIT